MPKYLVKASYTAEGLRGLAKDKGSGRKAAVEEGMRSLGAKVEGFYFGFGESDVYVICDCPDNTTAAALSVSVSSSGLVRITTVPLLTVEEMDQALSKKFSYRSPGA